MNMAQSTAEQIESEARALLAPHGLLPLGWFLEEEGRPALLVGNIGSSLWPAFSNSAEFEDGAGHAMDRWTSRVMAPIADEFGAKTRYPFGDVVWPFQHYAGSAMGMKQSPIGLLVHPQYGLWSAFRAVLVFQEGFEVPAAPIHEHPCDECSEKPCLTTCPVGAFTDGGYDYVSCRAHIRSDAGQLCRTGGCLARNSCPVGREYAYEEDQQKFHMAAFI